MATTVVLQANSQSLQQATPFALALLSINPDTVSVLNYQSERNTCTSQ